MSKTWEASDSISSLGMEIDDSVEVLENPSDAKNANSEKEQRRYQRRRADEESLPVPSQTATAAGEVTEEGVGVERRVHRALALVIDMSRSMSEKDLLPSRIELVLKVAREFVTEYFEQSPISLLSIIVMRNSVASIKTPFTSDRFALDRDLQELAEKESSGERTCTGEMSFQNGLRIAYDALRQVKHMQAASEVLIIFGATMSCDPGTISVTIDTFAKNGIVCNTIALAAEVYVAKKIALKTGGLSLVALNERHFRDLFFRFTRPSPVFNSNPPHTVEIGFPEHRHERSPTFCAW